MSSCSADTVARIDKRLFEAGQQCLKRLYLDHHAPVEAKLAASRSAMSEAGQELAHLARSAFPRGIEVNQQCPERAAKETKDHLETDKAPVLFNAAFCTATASARTDIVLRQQDGALDLFEVKSGMRVKTRHLQDLALQVLTIEEAGFQVRSANILHVNRSYTKSEEDVSTQLFRNVEVTERVRAQLPKIAKLVQAYRQQLEDDTALQFPTGTFCETPFPCPHLTACSRQEPAHPLRQLPELSRSMENQLHEQGINELADLDASDSTLSFRQQQTLEAVSSQEIVLGPFLGEELQQVDYPLSFLAVAQVTDVIPKFSGMRPWQQVAHAWAVRTLQEDGSQETATFVSLEKHDPRTEFVQSLSSQLSGAGMIAYWGHETLASIRAMLEGMPTEKQAIRAILSRNQLDMEKLFESGLFHASLQPKRSLPAMANLIGLQGDKSSGTSSDANYADLRDAWKPRVRATTKAKISDRIKERLLWETEVLAGLHARFKQAD